MSEFAIDTSLGILFLVVAGCNLAHFRFTRAGVLFYAPYSGFLTLLWLLAMFGLIALHFAGVVSAIWASVAIPAYLIFLNGYSIVRRQRRIQLKGLPPPTAKPPFRFRMAVIMLYLALIILFGTFVSFIGVTESLPHPPSWARDAEAAIGAVAGIAFAAVFFLVRKK